MNAQFPEEIAREIESLSVAFKRLKASRLKRRALVVLIYDALPSKYGRKICGMTDIDKVLDAAENLGEFYLKKADDLKAVKS